MSKKENDIFKLVDGYLNGLLSAEERKYVENQCEQSPVWKVAMEEACKRQELLEIVPPTEASEELISNTLGKIDTFRTGRERIYRLFKRSVMFAAAASIAIVGSLHLYYLNLKPSPVDLRVYGQSELLADTMGSIRLQVLDTTNNTGIENVPVQVELLDKQAGKVFQLASFRTNDQGTSQPRFRYPNWNDGEYTLRVTADVRGEQEEILRKITLKRSWKLMLSTDKPVYQPGQTILCRSLALRKPDLKPVAGNNVVFSITDPKGNVIFKQNDVNSRFGIASFECPLATEIIEGPYTIEAVIGDTTSKLTVEIKKYVLPKFKVQVDLDQSYYAPGQTVRGTVQADYYFGKPVATARVSVTPSTVFVDEQKLGEAIIITTDSIGRGSFSFRIPDNLVGREQDSGDATLAFDITATDVAGQEISRRITRRVTVNPIKLEIIPESGVLVRGTTNTIHLFASYADGSPAQVRVAITGQTNELQTSKLGVASFELTPESDEIELTIRATDNRGRIGRKGITLKTGVVNNDFLIRTDKAVYKGGDTIDLVALGSGIQPAYIDFLKDGQTILTESIEMKNGRGEKQFDLPPDIFGTLKILAYRFADSGLPVRKTQVVYVRQVSELNVESSLDLADYKPGEKARLTVTVKNDEGQPAPGAVSLSAVDEAVFGVLDQKAGMEGTFFTLEQELLKPIYAIYPWSPNLETSEQDQDRINLERALFTRAANSRNVKSHSNLDNVLATLVNNGDVTERMLTALDRDDLDRILKDVYLSEEFKNLLEGDSQHTLAVKSFAEKRRNVNNLRSERLDTIKKIWPVLLVVISLVSLIILLGHFGVSLLGAIVIFFSLLLIVAICLPSFSRARECSKRLMAASNLKGLDTAFQIAQHEGLFTDNAADKTSSTQQVRIREWFPETLLWKPELITDDNGQVEIEIDLADSITTWKLNASAISADGSLGASTDSIRVFQPFFVDLNLPVALTRGDEVTIPVVVYNYLDKPQTVKLEFRDEPWFTRLDEIADTVELQPNEVKSVGFAINVKKVGLHELQVTARGAGVADAIKRTIEIVPDGHKIEKSFNGTLVNPADIEFTLPENAIEGSTRAIVKIYPSAFSQVVEGLEGLFRKPYGCFEQTSSTTYPNVLVLDYLRQVDKNIPEIEAKAQQYIHLGYQRLIGFEVDGGGFDWFGRPPANIVLTAYGLMEFEDMARVHDVDPKIIARTREWLLDQRKPDGTWLTNKWLEVDPTRNGKHGTLSSTAYVAWAVFGSGANKREARETLNYLHSFRPESIDDPYVLALTCNALLAIDGNTSRTNGYLEKLERIKQTSADGKQCWWNQQPNSRTAFYSRGRSGNIETTSLAILALIKSNRSPFIVKNALNWLAEQRDSYGSFQSTQATVLGMKTLLAGTGKPLGENVERRITLNLNGKPNGEMTIPADQGEVLRQEDLTNLIKTGKSHLTLEETSDSGAGYQVIFSYHIPDIDEESKQEPLSIKIDYDRSSLTVGKKVRAKATVTNNTGTTAPMIILDLPIPAGFAVDTNDFASLVQAQKIAKYQVNPRSVVVYLRGLNPDLPLILNYTLTATMPVKIEVPPAKVYEYYDPDTKGVGRPASFTVEQAA